MFARRMNELAGNTKERVNDIKFAATEPKEHGMRERKKLESYNYVLKNAKKSHCTTVNTHILQLPPPPLP